MKEEEKNYLEEIYFDPQFSGSFVGPDKLYRFVKKDGKFSISRTNIRKWIQSQEIYTTTRLVKQKINRRKVIAPYIDYMWDADTASFRDYSKYNDGLGYFVLVIDILSRYIWTHAIKTPSAKEVKIVFENIFRTGRKPEHIRTDKGTEFSNKVVKKLFEENNINYFVTQNEVKANYAERAIQSMKSRIFRYLRAKQSFRWVDELSAITEAYNNTYHRSIKRSPGSVSKENENQIWEEVYKPQPIPFKGRTKLFKFNIGDTVRISKLRKPFQRYYSEHWTNEFFIIINRIIKQNIPSYTLSDYADELIKGIFYEPELQKIYIDENTSYNIEKVLKKRQLNKISESLVKWMGWPAKFNTWIPTVDITNYK